MAVQSSLRSLWEHRAYIAAGAVREVRQRYAGSGMGVVWHVLIPLVQIAVYFVVFSRFMGTRGADYSARSYGLYLCAGILPWFAFSDILTRGAQALVLSENYLKKLAIPEAVFVAQTVATSTLSLGLYLIALYALALAAGVPVHATWLLVPIVLVLFLGLGFGLALLLAPLCVFFRDVIQLLTIVVQVWFWLTPVVYERTTLGPMLQTVIAWNPPAAYLHAVRTLLVAGATPPFGEWAFMIALAIGLPWAGLMFIDRVHSDLRDAL
jgi:lipopolysaccharide transport system permease protein